MRRRWTRLVEPTLLQDDLELAEGLLGRLGQIAQVTSGIAVAAGHGAGRLDRRSGSSSRSIRRHCRRYGWDASEIGGVTATVTGDGGRYRCT